MFVNRPWAGDPLERFRIETVPTLVVVENKAVMARLERHKGAGRSKGSWRPGSTEDELAGGEPAATGNHAARLPHPRLLPPPLTSC